MKGGIAAGHRLTARAGARVLEEGGNAVDACVAATFAAWVAESPLTGPGAGGFALVLPGDGRPARVADFFVSTPGMGRPVPPDAEMHAIDVGFGGDSETTQVFNIGEASCAVPGAAALYRGDLAAAVVETVGTIGGITREDLAAYRVVWRRPVHARFRGHEVVSNPPPSSGGILIAYGLALLERVAKGAPGSADAVIALAEVMREQTRVRDDGFASALYRGGLARRLLSDEG